MAISCSASVFRLLGVDDVLWDEEWIGWVGWCRERGCEWCWGWDWGSEQTATEAGEARWSCAIPVVTYIRCSNNQLGALDVALHGLGLYIMMTERFPFLSYTSIDEL